MPEAVTATQTAQNQATTQTSTTTDAGSGKGQTQDNQGQQTEKSLLNQDEGKAKATKVEGAPESYADFTLPDGFEANADVMTEAKGIFKELGLPQANAQKLVDFYSKVSTQAAQAPIDAFLEQQKKWVEEVKASPEIGGKLGQVKASVSKMLDGLGDAKLAESFREAMDYTGAGNNPHFIRVMYRLAQKLTEGGHVSGQPQNSGQRPRTAAQALYPNLPSAGG